jgi:hypothetical protein
MIDFTAVTREIRSLLSRRRELLTFLGSVFAAMSLFLQNVLKGDLPPSLRSIQGHVFASYALLLLVPTLLLALRLAKLNAGMTLNGILYARLMQEQGFTTKAGPDATHRAARVNPFGVSFLMFFLADLLAGFAAGLLDLSLSVTPAWAAPIVGGVVSLGGLVAYLYFHFQAAGYARSRIAKDSCGPIEREQWEEHAADSLRAGNQDMITILALVGLIVFSAFGGISGLGNLHDDAKIDLNSKDVLDFGPTAYGLLMAVTCFLGMTTYIRLRVAIGVRSLQIDPNDRPFRPLKLTDSLLGFMLLAFLFVVSLHFLLFPHLPEPILLIVDGGAFVTALLAEQLAVVIAGWSYHPK